MSSQELRKLNAYPDWSTKKGIDDVIKYVESLPTNTKKYPANLTTRQRNRYDEKFENDYFVKPKRQIGRMKADKTGKRKNKFESAKLFYRPLTENGNYRINSQVLYPNEHQSKMKELYNNLALGAGLGLKAFYSQVSTNYLGITRKEAFDFLRAQGTYNISRPYKNVVNRPILAKSANERWGCDYIEMARYNHVYAKKNDIRFTNMDKINNGGKYKFIFTVVDFFSKKLWALPITTETAFYGAEAIENLFEEENTIPKIIQTDDGNSFATYFQTALQKNGVKHILTKPYASQSNGLIERMNRTLRSHIKEGFVRHNSLEWVKYLGDYVDNINSQKPARGKFSPNELWTEGYTKPDSKLVDADIKITDKSSVEDVRKAQQSLLLKQAESRLKNPPIRAFQVGDKVRIRLTVYPRKNGNAYRKREKSFEKKYNAITYTPEIYTVTKVQAYKARRKKGQNANEAEREFKLKNTGKKTYRLEDADGGIVVDWNKDGTFKKTPKYFFQSDLQFVPQENVPSAIQDIPRANQINRMSAYDVRYDPDRIPFVDADIEDIRDE